MPFTDIAPPESTSNKTGISMSLSERGKAQIVRISFVKEAQAELFGGPVAGKRFFAKVGRGAHEGQLLLTQHDDGDLEAKGSMHGSANIKMKAWDLLPKGKRPAVQIELMEPAMGGFLFKLPAWAKPSGVGGKMESEFGLKKVGQGRSIME